MDAFLERPGAGGYLLFRGEDSIAGVDWDNPVACVRSGVSQITLTGLGHTAGVRYVYVLRAVSDGGVLDENVSCVCEVTIVGGVNVSAAPNAPVADRCLLRATAGGGMSLIYYYSDYQQQAAPSALQVAQVLDGQADWDNLLASLPVGPGGQRAAALEGTWPDGATVRLALRCVSAAGAASTAVYVAAMADASAPPDVEALETEVTA